MRHPGWILGYHGCDEQVGEEILAGSKEIQPSTNDYGWLGGGAYFWENSLARAQAWAKFLASGKGAKGKQVTKPFVIGAIIDPGLCLDLTEAGSLDILKTAHSELVETFTASGLKMPNNEPANSQDEDLLKRKLDCAVVNFLHTLNSTRGRAAYDTVRGAFMEGPELFPGSKITARTHVQWCVRDPKKSIIGYFRPRDQDMYDGRYFPVSRYVAGSVTSGKRLS